MTLHNSKHFKENRKELRGNLTPAEAELWKYLKEGKLLGRKFRRQHSVGNYILDFYCPSERLAIELDAQVHQNSNAEYFNQKRDQALESLGIKVLRFENKQIFQYLEAMLQEISSSFSK